MKNLTTPVLSLPSNKTGHSASHGLGKLQDLVNRGLFEATQNDDGTISIKTATRSYTLESASPLLVRTISEILANGRGIDSELEWFEANCITSNQFKLFKSPEVEAKEMKKASTNAAVSYIPLVALDSREWLHHAIVSNVSNDTDIVSLYNDLSAIIAGQDKATKPQLVNMLTSIQSWMLTADQTATYKEIEARQAAEQARFNFLSSVPVKKFEQVSFEGAIQTGNFRLTLNVIDYPTARALLLAESYTVANPKFLDDGETIYLFVNAPKVPEETTAPAA